MPAAGPVLILTVLWAGCLLFAPPVAGADSGSTAHSEVRLVFSGDILLSRGVERVLAHDPHAAVRALRALLAGADLAVGNLEGAVGPDGDCLQTATRTPCFPIRDEFIPLLREAGFRAMSVENNHAGDLGFSGREKTGSLLAQNDLKKLSFADSPFFFSFGDTTVGLIALSIVADRNGPPAELPGVELRRKLRTARNLANVVFVTIHWGSEFLDWPDRKQRSSAEWLLRNGADIIVGHHPHLVQKPECTHGKPVYYSLGNLVFDQKYPSTREGMLADFRIRDGEVSCSAVPTHTPPGSICPTPAGRDEDSLKTLSACGVKLSAPLSVNGVVLRAGNGPCGDGAGGLLIEASLEGKVLWRTPPARIVSVEPMKTSTPRPAQYLMTLERHYSPMDDEQGLRPCVYEVRPDALVPKWRGTALAWPLVDAGFLPGMEEVLCALHRGDSFIAPHTHTGKTRVAAYRWSGFGFSGLDDPKAIEACRDYFR